MPALLPAAEYKIQPDCVEAKALARAKARANVTAVRVLPVPGGPWIKVTSEADVGQALDSVGEGWPPRD